MERVLQKPKPMSCDNDWKIIQNLNSAKGFISELQKEQDQSQTDEWLNKIANENKNSVIILKCDDEIDIAYGSATALGESVDKVTQQIQELSTSFEIEVKPNMAEAIEKLRELHIKRIEYLNPDDILVKQKYSQPPYVEKLHSKKVVTYRRCRIRNRPNSGHGFKK